MKTIRNVIYEKLLKVNPILAYNISKDFNDPLLRKIAKEEIALKVRKMGYGQKKFHEFSDPEQKEILECLSCLEENLLDFLEQIKKPG